MARKEGWKKGGQGIIVGQKVREARSLASVAGTVFGRGTKVSRLGYTLLGRLFLLMFCPQRVSCSDRIIIAERVDSEIATLTLCRCGYGCFNDQLTLNTCQSARLSRGCQWLVSMPAENDRFIAMIIPSMMKISSEVWRFHSISGMKNFVRRGN